MRAFPCIIAIFWNIILWKIKIFYNFFKSFNLSGIESKLILLKTPWHGISFLERCLWHVYEVFMFMKVVFFIKWSHQTIQFYSKNIFFMLKYSYATLVKVPMMHLANEIGALPYFLTKCQPYLNIFCSYCASVCNFLFLVQDFSHICFSHILFLVQYFPNSFSYSLFGSGYFSYLFFHIFFLVQDFRHMIFFLIFFLVQDFPICFFFLYSLFGSGFYSCLFSSSVQDFPHFPQICFFHVFFLIFDFSFWCFHFPDICFFYILSLA